jgi:hypothetical protein
MGEKSAPATAHATVAALMHAWAKEKEHLNDADTWRWELCRFIARCRLGSMA